MPERGSGLAAAVAWCKEVAGMAMRGAVGLLGTGLDLGDGPVLILAPHSDDEVLGCGGVIASAIRRGQAVHVVIATDGASPEGDRHVRRAESRAGVAELGADPAHVTFLDRGDGSLGDAVDDLADELAAIVARLGPSALFTTSSWDPHPDHRSLGLAVSAERVQAGLNGHCFEYAIWQWESPKLAWRWMSAGDRPKPWSVVRRMYRLPLGPDRAAKRRALLHYRSQTEPDATGRVVIGRAMVARFLGPTELFRAGPATPPDRPTMPGWELPDR